jgi:hypothetical protein
MMNDDVCQRLMGIASELRAQRAGMRFLDRYFTEPIAFGRSSLPGFAGMYAILVSDTGWQPRPYRPVYFGEAGNLAVRVVASHEKYGEWLRAAGAADRLYVAYHLMSGDEAQRAAFEKSLIREYQPECNESMDDSPRGLADGDADMRESFDKRENSVSFRTQNA